MLSLGMGGECGTVGAFELAALAPEDLQGLSDGYWIARVDTYCAGLRTCTHELLETVVQEGQLWHGTAAGVEGLK